MASPLNDPKLEALLDRLRAEPPLFTPEELDALDRALAADAPPEDPWQRPRSASTARS